MPSNEYNINIDSDDYIININPTDAYEVQLNEQGPQGNRGETGNGIVSYEKTGTDVLVDIYTITFTDGNTQTVRVSNGKGIISITGPVTDVLKDTYTIHYNDNTTSEYYVYNGNGIVNITGPLTSGLTDTYTINYNDGTTSEFEVENGNGITDISKISTVGLVDTYTISFSNGNDTTFTVTNGEKGDTGNGISNIELDTTSGGAGEDTTDYIVNYTNGDNDTISVYNSVIEDVTATITGGVGTPSVTVTDTINPDYPNRKSFAFEFENLKGETGNTGLTGNGISSITYNETLSSGLVDVYDINYTNGETDTISVTNGKDGTNGINGYSPTVITSKVGNDATITITDINGEHTVHIYDGVGAVNDVQFNGMSALKNGIANIRLEGKDDTYVTQSLDWDRVSVATGSGIRNCDTLKFLSSKYIAFANGGYVYSDDFTNWSAWTTHSNFTGINSMTYRSGYYIALNRYGKITKSADLSEWSEQVEFEEFDSYYWRDICSDGTNLIALRADGEVAISTDNGDTWTISSTTLPSSETWISICYDGSRYVAVCSNSKVYASTNGTTWTGMYTSYGSSGCKNILYNNGVYIMFYSSGGYRLSTNLTDWTSTVDTLDGNQYNQLIFDGEKYRTFSIYYLATAGINNIVYTDLTDYQKKNTAVTHTNNTAVGSTTQPVYVDTDGSVKQITYQLNKTVPSDAVFTDTTYSTFTGADTITAGSAGLVPAPTTGDVSNYLCGDGTWRSVPSSPPEIYWVNQTSTTTQEIADALSAGKMLFLTTSTNGNICQFVNEDNKAYYFASYYRDTYRNYMCQYFIYKSNGQWYNSNIAFENSANKVTSISSASTDTQYPSAKCVYNALQSAGSAIPIDYSGV